MTTPTITSAAREAAIEALLKLPDMRAGDTERDSAGLCVDTVLATIATLWPPNNASDATARLQEALEQAEGHEGQSVMVKCADLRAALSMGQTPDAVREALEPLRKLFDAAEGQWPKTPWKLIPSDGKPIIASERGGNLFRGYIATWQEAELVVGIVNALPAIFSALDSRAGDAGEGKAYRCRGCGWRGSEPIANGHPQNGCDLELMVHDPIATPAPAVDANKDTIAFVQEWLMSGDYPADTWTHEFAAAIDARCKPAVDAQEEAEHIRQTEMQEIADGAYGDDPATRGAARDYLVAPSDAAERS